jgi:ABC-type dipeptide/oligopeptide/nickel transport system permease subunit
MSEITPDKIVITDFAVREHRSLWVDAWRRLQSNNTARLGLVIVVVFVFSAVFAHYFWKYDPRIDLDYTLKLKPPTLIPNEDVPSVQIMGTDKLGRDIFRRVVHGGWNSLRVGIVAVTISVVIGVLLGVLAGFYESIQVTSTEKIFLMAFIGLSLGGLSAWVARQPIQAVLFTLLGVISAIFPKLFPKGKTRLILFAIAGMLIGAIPGFMINPVVAFVCGLWGLIVGLVLSYPLGGQVFSNIIMRLMDILLAFPAYLLAIAIVAFLGPGLEKGMIAIGVVGIPIYARLARSSVLSVAQKEYILASQSVGESHARIMTRHIFPNILSPLIVQATMGLASAILYAAALGFLGLGAIPPEPEWGAMLGDSYRFLASGAWWAVLFPGLAIMFSVLGFNLLGDGLRDALDPKLRI